MFQGSSEADDTQAAAAGLGLAVLAGLSRVPRLAAESVDRVPLLLKVWGKLHEHGAALSCR